MQAIVQPLISGAIGRSAGVPETNVSIDASVGNVRFANVNGSIIITQAQELGAATQTQQAAATQTQ